MSEKNDLITMCDISINNYKINNILFLNYHLDKPECKKCSKVLQELENIDDEADQLDIGFVKIHDEELAAEYNLGELPALVYYRHQIPIIYESMLIYFYNSISSTNICFGYRILY